MRKLEAADLLQIWERGIDTTPSLAILPLLLAAFPEISSTQLSQLTIGERDSLLLTQRERMFGSRLESCLLYTSPSPRDRTRSRMPSSA